MCSVVNKYKEEYDVYIGRGSKWGNPYSHKDGTKALYKATDREDSIQKYRQHLFLQIKNKEITIEDLKELNGKVLGCFCKPQSCHGDVIVSAVNWAVHQ